MENTELIGRKQELLNPLSKVFQSQAKVGWRGSFEPMSIMLVVPDDC